MPVTPDTLTIAACAKINLDLRILGVRADGFHDLRTVFQTLALHDVVTITRRRGAFTITCSDPEIPVDRRNLVWRAASLLWRLARRPGAAPKDVAIHLEKRIPAQAGLGGGSADAAATLIGLASLWALDVDVVTLSRLAARLGADVPFFLVGGTALGLGRGDDIYPLVDLPRSHVVVARPGFGVSTVEAYGWYDADARPRREPPVRPVPAHWPAWTRGLRNDLEPPVVRRHPTVGRIKTVLLDGGAAVAAMSGSGSAVFGVFSARPDADRAARAVADRGWAAVTTRTLTRADYQRLLARQLAGPRTTRID
ncbi:MAG: 4-(cytidine 5'-diphospho)-2-C-methyl-D-erythritol kinase [Vicinamibacterales bacterium]|nr:4-(cytidine 5'-diphospho)-2-C-methyl-D-erythritol kinase [Vicinamibacterales bacterium]